MFLKKSPHGQSVRTGLEVDRVAESRCLRREPATHLSELPFSRLSQEHDVPVIEIMYRAWGGQ